MAKELEPGRGPQLSQQELDLIERFQTAYNAIDRRLRKVLGKEKNASFTLVVKEYARSKPSWAADADYLEKVGDLRNVLVHERTESYQYLAIPTLTVWELLPDGMSCKRSEPTSAWLRHPPEALRFTSAPLP